jgi:hypothetical protein
MKRLTQGFVDLLGAQTIAWMLVGVLLIASYVASTMHPTAIVDPVSSHQVGTAGSGSNRHVAFTESGDGLQTTKKFAVSDDWDLEWAYNCPDSGDFRVVINGSPSELGVYEQGTRGNGTDHLHGGRGVRYLEIISGRCAWAVNAVSYLR